MEIEFPLLAFVLRQSLFRLQNLIVLSQYEEWQYDHNGNDRFNAAAL